MIAEVRFFRAFTYFNMSQFWGGVPLVTKLLTMEESRTVNSPNQEVVEFCFSELTPLSVIYLPPEVRKWTYHKVSSACN